MINRFREQVYQSFEQRGDAGMELIDALTSTPGVESPVELSESPLFRRWFSFEVGWQTYLRWRFGLA